MVKPATGEFAANGRYSIDRDCPSGYVPATVAADFVGGALTVTTVNSSSGASARRVNISVGDNFFKMTEGEAEFFMDAGSYASDKTIKFIGDKAYIPAEAVAKAFDKNIIRELDEFIIIADYEKIEESQIDAIKSFF